MSVAEFFAASNVLIVAGKGGVGKTTVGAAAGLAAARAGLDVLLIELEGRGTLAAPFGLPALTEHPVELISSDTVAGRLRGRRLTPDQALTEYLEDHGLKVGGRLAKTNVVDLVATTAPGIRDLLTLGKIRQLEEAGAADLIIVDAPAAGHAITFLRSAEAMADTSPSGPIRHQADLASAMLGDAARARVLLVTLPEETPVTELIETAFAIEDEVGVHLGPAIVNSVWPSIEGLTVGRGTSTDARRRQAAARFRLTRNEQQAGEIARLAAELPLPQIHLPFVFTTDLGTTEMGALAEAFTAQVETPAVNIS